MLFQPDYRLCANTDGKKRLFNFKNGQTATVELDLRAGIIFYTVEGHGCIHQALQREHVEAGHPQFVVYLGGKADVSVI